MRRLESSWIACIINRDQPFCARVSEVKNAGCLFFGGCPGLFVRDSAQKGDVPVLHSVLQRCPFLGSHRTAWELSVLCNIPAKINNLNLSTQLWYKRLLW